MDFDRVIEEKDRIIIKNVRNFKLYDVFECGQCFRWNKEENGNYIGVAFSKVIEVEKKDDDVIIYNSSEEDFINIWADYFDLYRDYNQIKQILKKDPILDKAVGYGEGIRLLSQEPFEILISFIISSNNRIPMIKKVIENISMKYGKQLEYKGKVYYGFPSVLELNLAKEEDLRGCSAGFRAKYIRKTLDDILCGSCDLLEIKSMDFEDCGLNLQKLSGVGPKVADCIMLFSMNKYYSFPVDVWVKRAMDYFYKSGDVSLKKTREFAIYKFGELAGFAQQYLFFYARETKLNI
ncbi:MAG: DNA-3-methyladenine glycosylase [Clostridiaceae bacterium]